MFHFMRECRDFEKEIIDGFKKGEREATEKILEYYRVFLSFSLNQMISNENLQRSAKENRVKEITSFIFRGLLSNNKSQESFRGINVFIISKLEEYGNADFLKLLFFRIEKLPSPERLVFRLSIILYNESKIAGIFNLSIFQIIEIKRRSIEEISYDLPVMNESFISIIRNEYFLFDNTLLLENYS